MFLPSLASARAQLLTDDEYAAAVLLSQSKVVRSVVAVLCIYIISSLLSGASPTNRNRPRLPTFDNVQDQRKIVQHDILYLIQERYNIHHGLESYQHSPNLAGHVKGCRECAMEHRMENRESILKEVRRRLQQMHSGEPLYPWRKHKHEDEVRRVEAEVRTEWRAYLEMVNKIN